MTRVFLGLGSNINREQCLTKALTMLQTELGEIKISPTFESEAIGFDGENFYNLVVEAETELALEDLISLYHRVEDDCGRERTGPKFGPRTLDIDLLTYGDLVCEQPLELPRDEILENAYVLWPLAIMAPDVKHPATGKTFSEHWHAYSKKQHLWQVAVPWDPVQK